MSARLHVLLPDTRVAERLVETLRAAGIDASALHAVARYDPDHPLPDAGPLETTDVAGASARGAAAGAVSGALIGLSAMVFPPLGIAIGGATVTIATVAGGGLGAWTAAMIGVSQSSPTVTAYEQAIADGQVLLMIDCEDKGPATPADIRAIVAKHAPRAEIGNAARPRD